MLVENKLERTLKTLQTNLKGGGGEFRSFTPYLKENGIEFRHPCPHTSQQND